MRSRRVRLMTGALAASDAGRPAMKRQRLEFSTTFVPVQRVDDCGPEQRTGWEAAIAAEPVLAERMSGVELDDALAAIADFADLKSPNTTGHSRGGAGEGAMTFTY